MTVANGLNLATAALHITEYVVTGRDTRDGAFITPAIVVAAPTAPPPGDHSLRRERQLSVYAGIGMHVHR